MYAEVFLQSVTSHGATMKSQEVTTKFENTSSSRNSLRAFVPSFTDSFRVYQLILAPGTKIAELPIPKWSPLIVFVIKGEIDVRSGHWSVFAARCDLWNV